MSNEPAITVDNISKNFVLAHQKANTIKSLFLSVTKPKSEVEVQQALNGISFSIKKGEFFGIVGRNGSGKSTLLKILAGIYQPTSGTVKVEGKLVPFIELGVGFNPELTGRQNVYLNGAMLGFSEKEIDAMYDDIVSFAEIERFMDQKLKNYSSGMQVRLAFSMATRAKADVLLVDEVLAVGDADFQRKCFDYFRELKKRHTTVIFVTHDMNAVREYCDQAILIEKSQIVAQGTPDVIASKYTRLFEKDFKPGTADDIANRWGDAKAEILDVSVKQEKITRNTQTIDFKMKIRFNDDIEDPVVGFRIRNATGAGLFGTNTTLRKQKIRPMNKDETIEINWSVPNIFNDGKFLFDSAVVYNGTTTTADWWDESVVFRAYNDERTAYFTNPSVIVTTIYDEKKV